MSDPFDTSSAILDAASSGATISGYEQVGAVLIQLGTTTAVPAGTSLSTSAVAAAVRVTSPGRFGALSALVKPGLIVLGVSTLAILVGLSSSSGGEPGVDPGAGADRVVERVASDLERDRDPLEPGAEAADVQSTSSVGGTAADESVADATVAPTAKKPVSTSSTPDVSSTSSSTTTVLPSTSSTPTTTVEPTTTTSEPLGNNGNGNSNGNGNGKGNHSGNGNGNGPGSDE